MAYINSKKILSVVQTKFLPAVYQSKTITPSNFQRVVTADNGYAALESVKIDGILVDPHTEIESVTDATTAYQKSVPAGALSYAGVNSLGGMSYKCENLLNNLGTTTTNNGLTFTISNGVIAIQGTPTSSYAGVSVSLDNFSLNGTYTFKNFSSNTNVCFIRITFVKNGSRVYSFYLGGTTKTNSYTFDGTETLFKLEYAYQGTEYPTINETFTPMLVKGSTAPTEFKPYFEGIRDSAVTSLVGAETITIPAAIQALDGYGWGVNENCYNYIDFESKKFVQKVGRYTFTGNETVIKTENAQFPLGYYYLITISNLRLKNYTGGVPNILTADFITVDNQIANLVDNTITQSYTANSIVFASSLSVADFKTLLTGKSIYYELATPVETDISQYIDTDIIEVAANGSLTFNNTYEQAVPSSITYLVEV